MNLWHLRVFQAVAKHASYTKAAEELRISQSAVSHEVRAFEKWLAVKLFDHIGKQICLTEAGILLEDYARRIFALVEDAQQGIEELKDVNLGRFRLGASTTPGIYWLPEKLGEFRQKFPKINVSLTIENTATIQQLALNNEIDLGIVGSKPENKDLHLEPICRDRLTLIVPQRNPLARRQQLSMRKLAGEKFILREKGSATRALVERGLDEADITVEMIMELGNTEAIKRAVASGLGLAIVSQHALGEQNGKAAYRAINLVEPVLERSFFLIHRKEKHLSAAARAFISLLKASLPIGD